MSAAFSSIIPHTRREWTRLWWVVVGAVNFVAFLVHVERDGTCTLLGNGRWVSGQYLARSHGAEIPFTPARYWFSYVHGIVFIVVHLVCSVVVWRNALDRT